MGQHDFQPNQLADSWHFGGYLPTKELARNMMAEAQTIAEKLGVTFRMDIERRIAGAEKVGKHKTSLCCKTWKLAVVWKLMHC